jgi:predicted  nucleic acid-binding Zn-ribbon protein
MVDEPDTNNNTIWKHDWVDTWGPHGVAPVMAISTTRDTATGNWTVDNRGNVHTYGLLMSAIVLMGMDSDWFNAMGTPGVSEETAYRMLHWTPDQWREANEDLVEEVVNLTERVEELEDMIGNGTGIVDELLAQIASLEENMSALQEDLNDSLENETILRGQVEWLRERLEEANETVDELEQRITVLESKVERLEESVVFKDENITKLEEQLRAERNNVTQLQWQLDNASAALAQAEADLASAERKLDDRNADYDDLQSRSLIIAVAALVAGMIIILVLLKMMGKL